jgi:hypothetical protein
LGISGVCKADPKNCKKLQKIAKTQGKANPKFLPSETAHSFGRGTEGENTAEAAGAGVVRLDGFCLDRRRRCLLRDDSDDLASLRGLTRSPLR